MDSDQIYSINVFSQISIAEIIPEKLEETLEKISFRTLCRQYGLDCSLIDQTLKNLRVAISGSDVSPYFVVEYLPPGGRPLIIYHLKPSSEDGGRILAASQASILEKDLSEKLSRFGAIYSIDLHPAQLKDMGLLLGYEVARWIGFLGHGLVRDLHGDWYTLNEYQAFIPLIA
jgi:hypothetical protein